MNDETRYDIDRCLSCADRHAGKLGVVFEVSERDGATYFVCPNTGEHVRVGPTAFTAPVVLPAEGVKE